MRIVASFLLFLVLLSSPSNNAPKRIPISFVSTCVDASWMYDKEWVDEAKWLENSIISNGSSLYDMTIKRFYSKAATRDNFLNSLRWAAESDTFSFVYLGSHGTDMVGYRCHLADGYVYSSEIKNALQDVKGKVVFMVDTCHAGALVRDLEGLKNVLIMASCTAAQSAYPMVFAPVLIDSLTKGDKNNNGYVDTEEICNYIRLNMYSQGFTCSSRVFKLDMSKVGSI